MSSEISHPLAGIVRRAAQSMKPSGAVDAERQRMETRFARPDSGKKVVLCDCSGSMTSLIGSLGMTKEDHLKIALRDVLLRLPQVVIVGFATTAEVVERPEDLPPAALGGSTNLGFALQLVAGLNPARTIIISDGMPTDSESLIRQEVAQLTGRVDTIYCGPDGSPACAFLQSLAKAGCGRSYDMATFAAQELPDTIRALLA